MKLSIIVFALFLPICISSFIKLSNKFKKRGFKRTTRDKFIVYIPEIAAVVGAADAIVFGTFIIFSPIMWPDENFKSLTIFYIVFGGFILLGIYLITKTLRFRVVVQKQNITVYPMFSKSYSFLFSEINTVTRQIKKRYEGYAERLIVRTEQGNKFIVDSSFVNYKKMVEQVIENVEQSKLQGVWDGAKRGTQGDGSSVLTKDE